MAIKRSRQRQTERIQFARQQRAGANEFADDLWQILRGRSLLRQKFRREHPIGPYTLDFVCLELKLNIEIDGKDHLTEAAKTHDANRDKYLKGLGYEVLRINGFRITQDLRSVREEIEAVMRKLKP